MDEQPGRGETPLNAPTIVRGPEQSYSVPRTSGLAIASLVLGVVGIVFTFLTALPGLVLGIVALCQIKGSRRQLTGTGLAIGGIVASALTMTIIPAAILLPVFVQAREKAREVGCQSNLKEIGTATLMYTQDYDEHFPPAAKWSSEVYPYIMSYNVFKCPDDDSGSRSSYAFNSALGGLSLKKVGSPASTVGTFDAHSQWDLAGSADLMAFRHNRGANVGFSDGHVQWTRGDNAAYLGWNPRQIRPAQNPSGL